MAELFFFVFLFAPVALIWWLITAKRKADRLIRERTEARPAAPSTLAYEESAVGADGLSYGRSYAGDDATRPPEDQTGVVDGIKAMEGRR